MEGGWVKLYRSTLNNPIVMKDADHLALWIYLLLEATHKEHVTLFGGKKITLQPGQLITGRKKISEQLGINEYKIYRTLNEFESEQQIAQQRTRYGSLISILKWNEYQETAQPFEQQMHNECTTNAQQLHTKQECKNNLNNIKDIVRGTEAPQRAQRDLVLEEWNKLPLVSVKAIKTGTKRSKSLNARIKEYGIDAVVEAIRSIKDSPFLLGQNKNNWQITLDWFVRPNNFAKVYDGNYLEGSTQGPGPTLSQERMKHIAEEARRKEREEWEALHAHDS